MLAKPSRAETVVAVSGALFLLPFLAIGGPAAANGPAKIVRRFERCLLDRRRPWTPSFRPFLPC